MLQMSDGEHMKCVTESSVHLLVNYLSAFKAPPNSIHIHDRVSTQRPARPASVSELCTTKRRPRHWKDGLSQFIKVTRNWEENPETIWPPKRCPLAAFVRRHPADGAAGETRLLQYCALREGETRGEHVHRLLLSSGPLPRGRRQVTAVMNMYPSQFSQTYDKTHMIHCIKGLFILQDQLTLQFVQVLRAASKGT